MMIIGYMTMPENFKYKDIFEKGRPVHESLDRFSAKHPPMPPARWAKLFAPFDALKGFGELISETEKGIKKER